MRPDFQRVVDQLELDKRLGRFHPILIGTPPLGIGIAESDLDVACQADDLDEFRFAAEHHYGNQFGFLFRYITVRTEPAAVAKFVVSGWPIELFCQSKPVEQQMGVRHFRIEQRLLNLDPRLTALIRELKREGLKTEPAFARLLRLGGDPYESLLELEGSTDGELIARIAECV